MIQRLEFHYTPKHGSWLNMEEIEFSVFSNQCLNRRIEDEGSLRWEIAALEFERNQAGQPSNGDSLPRMPGTSSTISIHRFNTDAVLVECRAANPVGVLIEGHRIAKGR